MGRDILHQVVLGNTILSYILFAAILIFGLTLKRLISRLLSKALYKLFGRFSKEHPEVFVGLMVRPVELLILFVVLYLAINQLSYPLEEVIFHRKTMVDKKAVMYDVTLINVIDKIFLFLIIVSVFWIILRIIDFVAHVFSYRARQTDGTSDDQIVPFVKELTKIIVIIFGFFVVLGSVFDLNVATIIAGLGIGGIAVALAAKETLENLLGSFTIFADKPFRVGDLVKVDNVEGTIEKVGFRSTWIRTADKTMVVIPNRGMIDGVLENLSMRTDRRHKFNIGLVYETSNDSLKRIIDKIRQALEQHPEVQEGYTVALDNFGDSSLDIKIIYLSRELDYQKDLQIRQDINFRIIEIVEEEGSGFAYPTQRSIEDTPKGKE